MNTFSQRMIRAAKLEVRFYKEVEADTNATGQAMAVVVLSSIAQGIGALAQGGIRGFALGTVTALIGWCVWVTIVYLIGTKILPEPVVVGRQMYRHLPKTHQDGILAHHFRIGEVLRTTGFAASPGLLRVLGFVPEVGFLILGVANVWMFMAMVTAVQQALDYVSLYRAVAVCLIGWLMHIVIGVMLR